MTHNSIFQLFLLINFKFILSGCQNRISILDSINKVQLINATVTQQTITEIDNVMCPNTERNFQIFPIRCENNAECKTFGSGLICCDKKCTSGIKFQVPKVKHLSVKNLESINQINPSKFTCPSSIQTKSTNPGLFSISCAIAEDCKFLGTGILCCDKICAKVIADANNIQENFTKANETVLICPLANDYRPQFLPFFSIPCQANADCNFLGRDLLCCNKKCINGVVKIQKDIAHSSRFFGLVDTTCPKETIAEALDVKLCHADQDCGGRICCPDKNGKKYCRTPVHTFDKIPGSKRFEEPIKNLVSFMQCTAPPPPLIDIFPKACRNNFDCFPNLCCQENGKKYCRPPIYVGISFNECIQSIHLLESNIICIFPETLATQIQGVLSDQSMPIGARSTRSRALAVFSWMRIPDILETHCTADNCSTYKWKGIYDEMAAYLIENCVNL